MKRPAIFLLVAMALLASFIQHDRQAHPQLMISNADAPATTAPAIPATRSYGGLPPARYQGDAVVVVAFTYMDGIEMLCGKAPDPKKTRMGCTSGTSIAIVHPCAPGFKGELFATIMCHEIGHANGWPADHGP